MILSMQNTSKRKRKLTKDKNFQIFSPAIHLEGGLGTLNMNT